MILTVNISWTLCMVRWCENFTSQYLLRACPPFYLELKAKWKNASESLKRSCSLLNTRTQWIRILQITRMLTIHIVYLSTPQNLQTLSMLTMSTFSKNPKHLCLFNLQLSAKLVVVNVVPHFWSSSRQKPIAISSKLNREAFCHMCHTRYHFLPVRALKSPKPQPQAYYFFKWFCKQRKKREGILISNF